MWIVYRLNHEVKKRLEVVAKQWNPLMLNSRIVIITDYDCTILSHLKSEGILEHIYRDEPKGILSGITAGEYKTMRFIKRLRGMAK